MSAPSTKTLDHIVHLTPPGSVQETSDRFRKLGFNVIPGGTHAGGLTANALVVFNDGVYLELISFTHPPSHYPPGSPPRQKRDSNPWAPKEPGWIDFAFLGTGSDTDPARRISDIINNRAQEDSSGTVYLPEENGGRERPDGRVLKWIITAPDEKHGRGTLPFFCGDVTPREWRVPDNPASNTHHPSTAQGIAHIRLLANADALTTISRQLTCVTGKPPISSTTEIVWLLNTHHKTSAGSHARLILSAPTNDEEHEFMTKVKTTTGIYEVGFWVEKGRESRSVMSPYGKIVWVPST